MLIFVDSMLTKYKHSIIYILLIGGGLCFTYLIFSLGAGLQTTAEVQDTTPGFAEQWHQFLDTLLHNLEHPLALLLLQIITIIVAARIFGYVCKRIGQPTVIGEIFAGIILGPSFVGSYFPEFSATVFPVSSLGNLQFLSQIGLILFMFVIGMELDLDILKKRANDALVISHASIIIPFTLGAGLAYFLYEEFAPEGVQFLAFALFLGISMSITAFPVLARIIQERGMAKSKVGSMAITCAAVDDITAWCLLAAVIAIVKAGSFVSSLYTILLAGLYVVIMFTLVQPFLKRLGDIYSHKENLSKPVVGIFFIVLLASSYMTEVIGIHALFGAFVAGVIMPARANFRSLFIEKTEDIAVVMLLPLFFVFTGLRTEIGLLNDIHLWKISAAIILVAVTGKFLGSAVTARFTGINWKDSLTIGALMNARGLMELVVLNIGFDLGVLDAGIFTMMVLMALVTTVMTGPALDLINRFIPDKPIFSESILPELQKHYSILIAFANPRKGRSMLRIAGNMVKKDPENASITAMHLSPSTDLNQFNIQEYEQENFKLIKAESRRLEMPVITFFKPAQDISREIADTADEGRFDLLLIGVGKSMFEGTVLGRVLGFTTRLINPGKVIESLSRSNNILDDSHLFDEKTRQILKNTRIPTGILIDKNLQKIDTILMPVLYAEDVFIFEFLEMFIQNSETNICLLDQNNVIQKDPVTQARKMLLEKKAPARFSTIQLANFTDNSENTDLVIVSLEAWRDLLESNSPIVSSDRSVLIMKPRTERVG
jgi:Kef-type K+ transport system membrane component KefB